MSEVGVPKEDRARREGDDNAAAAQDGENDDQRVGIMYRVVVGEVSDEQEQADERNAPSPLKGRKSGPSRPPENDREKSQQRHVVKGEPELNEHGIVSELVDKILVIKRTQCSDQCG